MHLGRAAQRIEMLLQQKLLPAVRNGGALHCRNVL